jgi:hypothetical protein
MQSKIMVLFFCIIGVATSSWAGFGGSRAGGFSGGRSFSSPSRSYSAPSRSSSFGGSRASSGPATITRPTKSGSSYSSSPPTHTTIVREVPVYHGGGFWTNFWMYQAISGNRPQQPIIVNQGQPGEQGYAQPVYVQQESHGFLYFLMWVIAIVLIGVAVWVLWGAYRDRE